MAYCTIDIERLERDMLEIANELLGLMGLQMLYVPPQPKRTFWQKLFGRY